jgi:hypothetical protein
VEDRAVHDWYRFVLSFPPHLVRDYLARFRIGRDDVVLDPFCGTGTTLVECKKHGIPSIGIEASPMAELASRVKVDWTPDPMRLRSHAREIAQAARLQLETDGVGDATLLIGEASPHLRCLSPDVHALLLRGSISPLPLHRTLVLLDTIQQLQDGCFRNHELLALASALVTSIANLHFGPEVGVGPAKPDAAVVFPWLNRVTKMADDLSTLAGAAATPAQVHSGDSRDVVSLLGIESIAAVITSPPYPNEKDYTRTTRLESVLLGFIRSKHDLRAVKRNLIRSNTRGVYKEDSDDAYVAGHREIERLSQDIENRRLALGKTSGFERLYARVTRLYFGGMARHLSNLRSCLRKGAHLAYVVGDQASYLRVMIRTGRILADIARSLGYEVVGLDLFRTRLATATREQLREEVLVLRWQG